MPRATGKRARLPGSVRVGLIRGLTAALDTARAIAPAGAREHIVDVLIRERAPRLSASPAWPLLRPLLYAALGYRPARRLADAIADLGGTEALDFISGWLDLKVAASEDNSSHIVRCRCHRRGEHAQD